MADSLAPRTFLIAYAVALLAMAVLDGLWLGVLARDFYQRELGPLMLDSPRWLPAALFYLLYPAALVFLGLQPGATAGATLLRCAAVGALAYGTYDLTNAATLRGFGARLAITDMAWGTCASALAGLAAWWAAVGRTA